MLILFCFLLCVVATTIGGISGIGGGVIIKPTLDAIGGMSVASISFLSGCTVLAMTATSLLRSRGGEIRLERRRGTILAIGATIGGMMGKELFSLALLAGGATVSIAQQSMMILLTVGVLMYTLYRSHIRTLQVEACGACCAIGLLLGLLSAFLGIGGGPINLGVLYFFFSMDSKTAALHSLYIIFFSQSASLISSLVGDTIPPFSWSVLLAMALGGILGGTVGRSISKKLDNEGVDRLFFWVLLVIIAMSCYNLLRCFV